MALSFAFAGDVGVSLAIGIALAHNEVANQVTAAIRNASHQVRATTGGVTLEARETAGIRAISAAAAIAVGAGFYAGIAIAGAGAGADNAIYTKVNAYLDASTVNAATTVSLTATDTATIRAIVAAVSVSVGIGVAGVGSASARRWPRTRSARPRSRTIRQHRRSRAGWPTAGPCGSRPARTRATSTALSGPR